MMELLATLQNSPSAMVTIIFFVGYTVGVWGIPVIKQFFATGEVEQA